MTLRPSQNAQNRRKEDQKMAEPLTPAPAAFPGKLRNGRPSIKYAPQACNAGLRGQCWWLMREINGFTINLLLETYADGTEKDAHNNVRHYLLCLESHGVVERLERRQPGDSQSSNGFVVWRLKRNLGILAPVWRRVQKVLWDPNARQIVPLKTAEAQQKASPVASEPDSHD